MILGDSRRVVRKHRENFNEPMLNLVDLYPGPYFKEFVSDTAPSACEVTDCVKNFRFAIVDVIKNRRPHAGLVCAGECPTASRRLGYYSGGRLFAIQ